MPLIIDEVTAQVSDGPRDAAAEVKPSASAPTPQTNPRGLGEQLERLDRRKARVQAD